MAVVFVPQYADSHAANDPLLGTVPKAEAFSSAAMSCCSSCILAWSSADRLVPVDVFDISLQKAPISFPRVSIGRPQSVVFPMPDTPATPGNVCPKLVPPNQAIFASCECVAQKPWVRVTPWPVFSNTQVTVSPFFSEMVAVCVFRSPTPVLPPLPVTVQL